MEPSMSKQEQVEIEQEKKELRKLIKPADTVYTKPTHTPTPWAVNGLGYIYSPAEGKTIIAEEPDEMYKPSRAVWPTNAAHIVRCVNEREGLLKAMQSLINNNGTGAMDWAIKNAQAIIAQAEQEG